MSHREFYENGYGVSIISSDFSYGLELAILRGNGKNAEICYDTPITEDVCGHLNSDSLAAIIKDVKALPIPNHCVECDKPCFDIICDDCKEKDDEEPLSICCAAPFTYPGWPDSDFCSQCHEHSGIDEDDDVEAKTIGVEDEKNY